MFLYMNTDIAFASLMKLKLIKINIKTYLILYLIYSETHINIPDRKIKCGLAHILIAFSMH